MEIIWGIDFGKKLSGNTVICEKRGNWLSFYRAIKNEDADQFILQLWEANNPHIVFIDAPLSLPGAYYDSESFDNYFYRTCDMQLQAMSPMFLGGFTARAIKLKDHLISQGVDVRETYPKALAKQLKLNERGYRSGREYINACLERLRETSTIQIDEKEILSWHHFDALLALLAAVRYKNRLHLTYGNDQEGLIYI
jgi:predicted nuclease with RNAse H fold